MDEDTGAGPRAGVGRVVDQKSKKPRRYIGKARLMFSPPTFGPTFARDVIVL